MRDEWFCSGPKGRIGPLTFKQLKQALAKNPHANDIFVWHESLPDWVRAGDLDGLDQIHHPDQFRGRSRPAARPMNISNYGPEEAPVVSAKRRFSIPGVSIGLLLIILGCVVFYFGMIGEFTFVSDILETNKDELNALSGGVLFVLGIIFIWGTRYRAD
jgi:GYF domain 2